MKIILESDADVVTETEDGFAITYLPDEVQGETAIAPERKIPSL